MGAQSGFCKQDPDVTRAGGSEPLVGQRPARLTPPRPCRLHRLLRTPSLPPQSHPHGSGCEGLAAPRKPGGPRAPGDSGEVADAGLCLQGTCWGRRWRDPGCAWLSSWWSVTWATLGLWPGQRSCRRSLSFGRRRGGRRGSAASRRTWEGAAGAAGGAGAALGAGPCRGLDAGIGVSASVAPRPLVRVCLIS